MLRHDGPSPTIVHLHTGGGDTLHPTKLPVAHQAKLLAPKAEPKATKGERNTEETQCDDHHTHDEDEEGASEESDIDVQLAEMRKHLEGAHGSKHTKATVGKLMKKPGAASIAKRPAASVLKRPASASDRPKQPKLQSRFDAINYQGCKIYWGGDRRYRVLTKPKTGTANFTWQTKDEAPAVWKAALECCEDNAH